MTSVMFISEIERRERESKFLQNAKSKHASKFDYKQVHYHKQCGNGYNIM